MRTAILPLLFFALIGSALAQSTDIGYQGLSFTPRGFGQAFDDAATGLDVNVSQRSELIKCAGDEWTLCTFQLSELAYAIIGGKDANAPARDAMMVIAVAGDNRAATSAMQGLLGWAALVKLLRPELNASARGDLMMRFMDAVRENAEDPVEIKSGDVTFSVSAAAGMRIWLSAQRD
jgi:hypothetical protein